MSLTPEEGLKQPNQLPSFAVFFNHVVQRLLQDNIEFVLTSARNTRQNTEVLHLIDRQPRPGKHLGYHFIYASHDTVGGRITHGLYISDHASLPRRRVHGRYSPMSHSTIGSSRHYFENGQNVVVREDRIGNQPFEYEFLRGSAIYPSQIADQEAAFILADFQSDMHQIYESAPIKPLKSIIEHFVNPNSLT